jgi:hypothetical protein
MRRLISSKSQFCTESMDVDVAGISVKVTTHYPGRSVRLSSEGLLILKGIGKA